MGQKPTKPKEEADRFEAVRSALAGRVARWTARAETFATIDPCLTLYRHDAPTEPMSCMVEPAIALTLQGVKHAVLGNDVYRYDKHRFLLTTLNLPVVLQAVEASPGKPYLSLVLKLDERAIAELVMQSNVLPPMRESSGPRGIVLGETTTRMLEVFDRLVQLLDEPSAAPVLAPLLHKEIYYRLLSSEQGSLLWQLATVGSQGHRIGRAIEWLKTHFAQTLRVDDLAANVQMSPSRFHHHFRQFTAMSPLQFQKQLRLNEARRLMLTEHLDASTAAFRVGYESPSQFSREYRRQFGAPPRIDIDRLSEAQETVDAGSGTLPTREGSRP
jgi:AraC-like DNA-binding protein